MSDDIFRPLCVVCFVEKLEKKPWAILDIAARSCAHAISTHHLRSLGGTQQKRIQDLDTERTGSFDLFSGFLLRGQLHQAQQCLLSVGTLGSSVDRLIS